MKKFTLSFTVFFLVIYGLLIVYDKETVYAQEDDYKSMITVKITEETANVKTNGSEANGTNIGKNEPTSVRELPHTGEKKALLWTSLGLLILITVIGTFLWINKPSKCNKKGDLNL